MDCILSGMAKVSLGATDYVVICGLLSVSVGIGLYYAIRGRKRGTREDYLLGGRRLHVLPVTMSLFVSYTSSASMIGLPAETFTYGFVYAMFAAGLAASMTIFMLTLVPMMHNLKITSMYEYFYRRFGSWSLRLLITVLGMLQNILLSAVIVLAPALSIEAAAGLPLISSILLVGTVGTVFTAIGGLRGVVAADGLQGVVMVVGILSSLFKGVYAVGGFGPTWEIAVQGGRVPSIDFSLDPRVRHSFWGLLVGGTFTYMAFTFDQSAMQRVFSLPTARQAQMAYAINIFSHSTYTLTMCFMGLVAYAFYTVNMCDPLKGGYIKNKNQLLPYFIMEIFQDIPGMPGLFLATLLSASLSTFSSILNGLATNTVEDLLQPLFDKYSTTEEVKLLVAKTSVFFFGCISVGLSFLAHSFPGTVIQAAVALVGACAGPLVGIFFLSAMVPWANKLGAASGVLLSLVLNAWITIGGVLYGRRPVPLPPVPGNSCMVLDVNRTGTNMQVFKMEDISSTADYSSTIAWTTIESSTTTSGDNPLYNISYLYYGLMGWFVAFVVGLVVSLATRHRYPPLADDRVLFPFIRKRANVSEADNPDKRGEKLFQMKLMHDGERQYAPVPSQY
ncbi:sodium-coupled monocarboxylate transporter 1-like [Haliotis rufescens]|uniref:sodium-coupled monocarboxylate transporter 1-like n=1 Tax=Haliotis rufescens TaxID=6454 RepID=UPI00201E9D9F|nr:sodium-coupled monocarboxylate transporter 1-like [Haliotis rufescens]